MTGPVLVRAGLHAALAVVIVCAVWAALTWLGVPEVLSVGIGVVFALAPGVNDYLGRDIRGNRIDEFEAVAGEDPFLKFREGKYSRSRDETLNSSDFVFISRLLTDHYQPLATLIADLDLVQWRALDPESELVEAIMESLATEIDETPNWAKDGQLPLYPLFLMDLLECLQREMSIDYVFDEERQRNAIRQAQHERHRYH